MYIWFPRLIVLILFRISSKIFYNVINCENISLIWLFSTSWWSFVVLGNLAQPRLLFCEHEQVNVNKKINSKAYSSHIIKTFLDKSIHCGKIFFGKIICGKIFFDTILRDIICFDKKKSCDAYSWNKWDKHWNHKLVFQK